jgi:hypothetical protein
MRLSIVALALVGCSAVHGSDPDDDPSEDPSKDPNCHWDCFGATECRDGKAIAWANTAVPCSRWTGECPRVEVTCAGGCALELRNDYARSPLQTAEELRVLCAETPVVEVGARCTAVGCLPIRATTADDDTATLSYLACEPATGTCAIADPPMIDGYLTGCPQDTVYLALAQAEGITLASRSPFFDLQWCLVARSDTGAIRHGLTTSCYGDWDCPAGSTCDTFFDPVDDVASHIPVCRPGPRDASLFDRLPEPEGGEIASTSGR